MCVHEYNQILNNVCKDISDKFQSAKVMLVPTGFYAIENYDMSYFVYGNGGLYQHCSANYYTCACQKN